MKIGNFKLKICSGFTIAEMAVGSAVFAIIAVSVFQTYSTFINLVAAGKYKILATDVVNEQFELIRNLKYSDVGLKNGIPLGVLVATTTVLKSNTTFHITRTIRNIDDPFDGQLGSSTNDLSPSDYKLVEIGVECPACKNFVPISVTGRVAPKNLETASTNGALFIKVFDGSGNPLPGVSVHVVNVATTSTIVIDDVTNNQGLLAIVDAPPGVKAYRIIVTKSGYSTDRTYATSTLNPNPVKPDATVLNQQVTQVSFVIDKLSSANIFTLTDECSVVPGVDFDLKGSKLIGVSPDVFKFDNSYITDALGFKNISNLEWDTFSLTLDEPSLYIAGTNPPLPFSILPDSSQNISITLTPNSPNHLLITVLDSATLLPVSGASITLSKTGYSETVLSGRGYLEQTDWSSGVDETDGNLSVSSPAGDLKLKTALGQYVSSGMLTSTIFDTGTSSNFGNIFWSPTSQPVETGQDSLKFQIATAPDNTAETVWNYVGPDSTSATYYTVSDTNIDPGSSGDRYFRYKVFFSTLDRDFTPLLANIAITFTSDCIPPGQTLFSGLSNGNYDLEVSKAGYTTLETPVIVDSVWQKQDVILLSN